MLSDELEALAADTIRLFGVSLVSGAFVRKLKRLAGDARDLERRAGPGAASVENADLSNVADFGHARRQKRLALLIERGKNESGH